MRRLDVATSDAATYVNLRVWQTPFSAYAGLLGAVAHKQAGNPAEAGRLADEALVKLDAKKWRFPIFRYLDDQISEGEILKLAASRDETTDAHTYVALNLLASAESPKATAHLKWVLDKGAEDSVEYELVLAQLAHLEGRRR